LVGIRDPPRPDVKASVEIMRRAGVRVFVVTGDFKLTAIAIARQVGIVTVDRIDTIQDIRNNAARYEAQYASLKPYDIKPPSDSTDSKGVRALVLVGDDLLSITSAEWDAVFGEYTEIVFARTTPEQKLRIVEEAKRRGDSTVAVTGDGVNDGPALKAADIGIAMGSGSDVAKEAASIILLNNDFASIPVAIENGRLVFDNLKKVILYQIPTGSYTEFITIVANFFFGMQAPLTSYLQVIICVTNDVAMSISLMYESAESDLMVRKPRNARTDRLADWRFFLQIYGFLGLMIWPSCFLIMFMYYSSVGLGFYDLMLMFDSWGTPGTVSGDKFSAEELAAVVATAQCVFHVAMVTINTWVFFIVRNRRVSILESNPFYGPRRNLLVFVTITVSYLIAITNLYTPGIQYVFLTTPVPLMYWFLPWAFGAAILIVDELRKLIVRSFPNSLVAKCAW
ncbi:HAD-like domain-containing protein, partial [Entophlyctis helioformis]